MFKLLDMCYLCSLWFLKKTPSFHFVDPFPLPLFLPLAFFLHSSIKFDFTWEEKACRLYLVVINALWFNKNGIKPNHWKRQKFCNFSIIIIGKPYVSLYCKSFVIWSNKYLFFCTKYNYIVAISLSTDEESYTIGRVIYVSSGRWYCQFNIAK